MGSIKNKPWDDVIQFDDWKKDEVPAEDEQTEKVVEESVPAEIQGLGINRDIDDNEEDLFGMIANLNAGNSEYAESVAKKEQQEAERAKAEQRQKEAEAIANAARLRFEQEQAERDRITFEQEQERARVNAELQAKKEKSLTHKLASFMSASSKKKASSNKPEVSDAKKDEAEENASVEVNKQEEVAFKNGEVMESEAAVLDAEELRVGENPELVLAEEPPVEEQNDEAVEVDQEYTPLEESQEEEISCGKVEVVGKRKPAKKPKADPKKEKKSKIFKSNKQVETVSITGEDPVESPSLQIPSESKDNIEADVQELNDTTVSVESEEPATVETSEKVSSQNTLGEDDGKPEKETDISEGLDKEDGTKSEQNAATLSEEKEDSSVEKEALNPQDQPKEEPIKSSEVEIKQEESLSKSKKKASFWSGLFKKQTENEPVEAGVKEDSKEKGSTGVSSEPDWEFIATHDELTGLLNQNAYEQAKKQVREKPYAVVVMDVNNLKYANDTFGHEAGNKLIVAVSDQVKELFPDCGYRTGGDEFVAIVPFKKTSKIESEILEKKKAFLNALKEKTKEEKDSGLIYSASFGYSYSDGKKPFAEVAMEADKAMYSDKEAYKKSNPQYDMRKAPQGNKEVPKGKVPTATPEEVYDEFLTDKQKKLKKLIQDKHIHVSNQSTMEIVREVQRRSTEVIAILIASPTFDELFIILSADSFCECISELGSTIDFSYLYIIYKDGAQYKGSDEYLGEVTDIFEALGKGIAHGKIQSEKDILKIKGINIFKQIYIA